MAKVFQDVSYNLLSINQSLLRQKLEHHGDYCSSCRIQRIWPESFKQLVTMYHPSTTLCYATNWSIMAGFSTLNYCN